MGIFEIHLSGQMPDTSRTDGGQMAVFAICRFRKALDQLRLSAFGRTKAGQTADK
ncbi:MULTISPECIES: hypothetical protein [Phyllobacteriaceae]|nr:MULTISPECIES: hypothetical protein [Mesorhizobium]